MNFSCCIINLNLLRGYMKKLVILIAICLFLNNYGQSAEVSQQDMQRYSAYYSNGVEYFKNKQYSSSIIEFKKVLRFSPYDTTTLKMLANAYWARGENYRQETKEIKKALCDYKSAYFYLKYWSKDEINDSLASSALKEINEFERRLQNSQTPAQRLQDAKILKAQGELAAAGYNFQLLKDSAYKEEVYENLGNIYKNLNNLMQAMDYYRNAIEINPKNAKLHFLYGVMLDSANNYEASMEQYNLALKYGDKSPELLEILENKWTQNIVNNPNDSMNYVNLGAIYQKQGNFDAAYAQYQKAFGINPDDETILNNIASLYVEKGDFDNAMKTYDKLLLKNPKNIEVMEYKANAFISMKNFEEAINQYNKIIAIDPDNKQAKANMDDIIYNKLSPEHQQKYLAQIAQSQSTSYDAQFNYALELHKSKNYTEALEYYKKAMIINPIKEEPYLNIAQIYFEQKKYNQAEDACNKGLLLVPNSVKISQYLAEIKDFTAGVKYEEATKLYEAKQYKQAIDTYLKIPNRTKEVKTAIASCYWQLNDFKNANKYYLEILKAEPNNVEILTNSAWAYYSLNDFANAKIAADRILYLDKTNTEAKKIISSIDESQSSGLLQKGIKEYENGEYTNALISLNSLLSKKPNDEYGIYYKGLILDELKNPTEAIKQYRLLISKNQDFAEAYYSLAVDLDNIENYKEAVANYEKFLSLKKQEDETTKFAVSRIKELKDYLNSLNKK